MSVQSEVVTLFFEHVSTPAGQEKKEEKDRKTASSANNQPPNNNNSKESSSSAATANKKPTSSTSTPVSKRSADQPRAQREMNGGTKAMVGPSGTPAHPGQQPPPSQQAQQQSNTAPNSARVPPGGGQHPSSTASGRTPSSGSSSQHAHGRASGGQSGMGSSSRSAARRAPEDPHVGKYKLLKTIGKGNFAKVKLAKHTITGQEVAIKIIDKTALNPSSLQKLFREVKIMKQLDHPNIVKLYQVMETEQTLYLVLEYASGGEVFDYLVAHGRMKEKKRPGPNSGKSSPLDLKAENLLLDQDMNIKIADFGFSNHFSIGNKLDTFCGSPPYAAPELFSGKKYDGPEVDVWSLGVILYTLVSGSLPFDGQNLKELRERVLRGKYRIPFYMSTDCENLLKKFLVLNPARRSSLDAIMKDRWMNIGYEDDELRPYLEPPKDQIDESRIEKLIQMGFNKAQILDAVEKEKFEDIHATYLLLGERKSDMDAGDIAMAQSLITHSSINVSSTLGTLPAGVITTASAAAAASPSRYSSRAGSAQSNGAGGSITAGTAANSAGAAAAAAAAKQPSRRSSQNDAVVGATGSNSARAGQVILRNQPNPRHPALSLQPPTYKPTATGQQQPSQQQQGVPPGGPVLFSRPGTTPVTTTTTQGPRKSSDPKGRIPLNQVGSHRATTGIAPSQHQRDRDAQFMNLTSSALMSKLAPAPQMKIPAAMAQAQASAAAGAAPLQKSGSQISHAPTEPVIKEDEDESSESSIGTPTANGSGLPLIGGGTAAGTSMPPASPSGVSSPEDTTTSASLEPKSPGPDVKEPASK
ncbi:unnamed protein product [Caenorhabditis auriculariae]|uniref:non-specific serine/threonine protein kinase n=1 Tax=Caenorhabditis auriculariae TaxID=2777116 RepID=A0A8S1H364_9PELO|nr:unnamed protein product [Caenorhabditis auriculariae]